MSNEPKRGRGRPALNDSEESYTIYLKVDASMHDAIADFAVERGITRATGPDMSAATRRIVSERLGL